jgi:hypothetical protein
MISELAAAVLGGFLAAGTGWILDRQRETAKLANTRRLLSRAIRDDLIYSLRLYDKISEEWEKTKIVWFATLNELRESRQSYTNSKEAINLFDSEDLRRAIFRYYLQSSDRISQLEFAQRRKYELERIYNDLIRQIQMKDETATPEAAQAYAIKVMANEDKEYRDLMADLPNKVAQLVSLKSTAEQLTTRLDEGMGQTK